MRHMTTRFHVFNSSPVSRAYLRLCSHHPAWYPPLLSYALQISLNIQAIRLFSRPPAIAARAVLLQNLSMALSI